MREKKKQERLSGDRQPEKLLSLDTAGKPAPIDEERFGRRAGEIIARAAGGVGDAAQSRVKRK